MSIADLNAASEAMNALTGKMTDFMNGVDAELAARQAAYDGLAGNLEGVVRTQMYFSATWDPDDPAPTNVRGGVYNSSRR